MNKKLGKDDPRTFPTLTKAEIQSLDVLKNVLTSTPILAPLRANGLYTIDSDVWEKQVRGVQLQAQDDGTNRAIGYWS